MLQQRVKVCVGNEGEHALGLFNPLRGCRAVHGESEGVVPGAHVGQKDLAFNTRRIAREPQCTYTPPRSSAYAMAGVCSIGWKPREYHCFGPLQRIPSMAWLNLSKSGTLLLKSCVTSYARYCVGRK